MAQLLTNDLRVLALLVGLKPEYLSEPDDVLLGLILHESGHHHHQGTFRDFYYSIPTDLSIKFMTDKRVLNWLVANASAFIPAYKKLSLADRLELGVKADIWYDLSNSGDLEGIIDDTHAAMLEAAKLLRQHGLDK
jgi:hypothetical protein